MNTNVANINNEPAAIKKAITMFGVKPINRKWPNFIRMTIFLMLIAAVAITIVMDKCTSEPIYNISQVVKPGSTAYNALMDLDDSTRWAVIMKLHEAKNEKKKSMIRKYTNNVFTALASGVVAEYIVSGNITKPMNIVARTILFTLLNTVIT